MSHRLQDSNLKLARSMYVQMHLHGQLLSIAQELVWVNWQSPQFAKDVYAD